MRSPVPAEKKREMQKQPILFKIALYQWSILKTGQAERSYQTLQLFHYKAHGQLKLDMKVWNTILNLKLQLISFTHTNLTEDSFLEFFCFWQILK